MDRNKKRILCVNCNFCVNTFRRYRVLEQNTRVCTILCSWVYPQIITDEDYVCEACWKLSVHGVNQNLQHNTANEPQAGPSPRGHTNICILCGCSLYNKQNNKVLRDNPTELQRQIAEVIKRHREPRQITTSDKVCHACWWRTKREVLRMNRLDELRVEETIQHRDDNAVHTRSPNEPTVAENISIPEVGTSEDLHEQDIVRPSGIQRIKPETILLPDYKRAPNNAKHCIFSDCNNTDTLHSVSDKLRSIILSNHKFYVPKQARVCSYHLFRNSWDNLYESEKSINRFNVDHVQHIFSFTNSFNSSLDFENFHEMDDRIFEYWVGLSKETFNVILEEVPRILEIKGGKLGLVSLLLKHRTGDSNEKIAAMMQKPRRTLEVIMHKVREALAQSELRVEEITRLRYDDDLHIHPPT